jgi:hypothetical protein
MPIFSAWLDDGLYEDLCGLSWQVQRKISLFPSTILPFHSLQGDTCTSITFYIKVGINAISTVLKESLMNYRPTTTFPSVTHSVELEIRTTN